MIGTIVNVAAILFGGALGLLLKKGVKDSLMSSIMKVEGVAVFIIGLSGVVTTMVSVNEDGSLSDNGGMLLLISLVVGTFIGEVLRIDDRINNFGLSIEKKLKSDGFAKGFVSASIIYCIGSMGIMGAINDGLSGDSSLLLVKSVLDGVTSVVLASTMGYGVLFSAVPLFIYQGLISLFASSIAPVIETLGSMMTQFNMVGSALIMCIGFNFVTDSKIKTANLLPSLLIPILYNLFLLVEIF